MECFDQKYRFSFAATLFALCGLVPTAGVALEGAVEEGARNVRPVESVYIIKITDDEIKAADFRTFTYTAFEGGCGTQRGHEVTYVTSKPVLGGSFGIDGVILNGPFEPNTSYCVQIGGMGDDAVEVVVQQLAVTEGEGSFLFSDLSRFGALSLEPLAGENTDGFGFAFDAKVRVHDLFKLGDTDVKGLLQVEGEVASETEDDTGERNFDQTIRGAAEVTYRFHRYYLDVPGDDGIRQLHSLSLHLKPAGFEADQGFDLVDYTATALLTGTVPYTERPGYWFRTNMDFRPMQFALGYTYAQDVDKDSSGNRTFAPTSRFDSEVVWRVPLADSLRVLVRWKGFYDLENDDSKDRFLGKLEYFLDSKKTQALTLSYKDGGDAPTFTDEKAIRVGFDIKLGKAQ